MARNRMIKPEFWSSEDIMSLPIDHRLLYIGLWNFADDSGILPHKPMTIKCQVFPSDNIDCGPMIEKLVTCGLLVRYNVGTDYYIRIQAWDKHQTIKHPTYRYPVNNGTIPVHVRYKSGTPTEPVRLKEKEKEKEKEKVNKKKDEDQQLESDFNIFWADYPKKENKPNAKKTLIAKLKSGITIERICEAMNKSEALRRDKQYIPNPQAWLNGDPWDDELFTPLAEKSNDLADRIKQKQGEL